jgi:hypothetical protein
MNKRVFIFIIFSLLLPIAAFASIGVGVGTGKIYVDEKLKAGQIYDLPALSVLNTGDEPSQYGVSVEYNEIQPQLKPSRQWFVFYPASFELQPGQAQTVQIRLSLPLKGAAPGDYLAYLEAHPVKNSIAGQTNVGIAAAAKLYFTVAPANFFAGLFYRAVSIFELNKVFISVAASLLVLAFILWFCRKYLTFKFKINLRQKTKGRRRPKANKTVSNDTQQ